MNSSDLENLSPQQRILGSEMLVLQALCAGTPDGSVHAAGLDLLKDYPFLRSEHQVLYDCLSEIPSEDYVTIQSELPRRLTVRGFPDLKLKYYCEPVKLSATDVIVLMETLRRVARQQGRTKAQI